MSLDNHPELNEQGIPYRNSTKRSSVAEAHRRALARREQERVAKEEREQSRLRETVVAIPPTGAAAPVEPSAPVPPLSPANRTPLSPSARVPLRPIAAKPEGEGLDLSRRNTNPLPSTPPRPPMMPKPNVEAEIAPEVSMARDDAAARDEAVDRVIPNVLGPIVAESPRDSGVALPAVPLDPVPPSAAASEAVPDIRAEIAATTPDGQATMDSPTLGTLPEESGSRKRYWHERPATSPYTRLELPSVRDGQRSVNPIGRQRPEMPTAPRPTIERRIRTMEEAKNGLPAIEPPATSNEAPPRTRPLESAPPQPVAPSPQEILPRQIDEALLRQLETNWRTQALAVHTGQRCGNCRFFRPTEGGQGNCGCSFSNVYGRPVESQGLDCLDGLGTWWSATDDGWLERTERRPRRATPLLDALLREREEELARSMPERRRAR